MAVFKVSPEKFCFSVKVSGLHWHVTHPSRATEALAGYDCCSSDKADAYLAIAGMLKKSSEEAQRWAIDPVWKCTVRMTYTLQELYRDDLSIRS